MKRLKTFEKLNDDDIFKAIHDNDLNKVKELIDSGINLECVNINSWTPLYYATSRERKEIVKDLIKNGANVNSNNKYGIINNKLEYGVTPLMASTNNSTLNITDILIDAGADWDIKDYDGYDFFDYLSDKDKQYIINKHPEKYQKYLMKKETEKYNI